MKTKKVIGMLILIVTLILSTVAVSINTYAAEQSYYLGITNVRASGGAYGIGVKTTGAVEKKIWKIVSYPTASSNQPNYSNSIYCIKAEHGFANEANQNVSSTHPLYDTKFNMKTQSSDVMTKLNAVNSARGDAQLTQETYNKIMWIIDHMYIANSANAVKEKQELLQAAGITNDFIDENGNPVILLTDDDIDVVQQLALWYFTNPSDEKYHKDDNSGNPVCPILYFNNLNGKDEEYKTFDALYDNRDEGIRIGTLRQNQVSYLYRYFIKNANPSYEASNLVTSPVTLNKSNFKKVQVEEEYIIGPLNININTAREYNITELGFKDQNGNTIELTGENKLLNANKQVVNSGNIQDVIGQDFYISLPITTKITKVAFNIKATYNTTEAMYYTTNTSTYLDAQPVVLVEKKNNNYSDEATVILEPKTFDLALRKFITKINGEELQTSRVPVVDLTKLISGESTTATYNHPKAPISVKIGDIVTYTIRVYNEGDISGYASEITDHLPEMLEFLPEDEENILNGWVYDENDISLRTVKTKHLSKDVDEDNVIRAFNGTTLDYKDITIKCKVKDTAKSGYKITNIADITDFTDKAGRPIVDRDSEKNNVKLPTDEQLPNYKDEEIEKGDKYIPGQEDDDDFEKLKIQVFDLALRKFITAVDNKSITSRIPVPTIGEQGNIKYNHTKEPVEVQNGNIVTYTLRIFNEGDISGYASEITDDLPEGLLFLPDNDLNKIYRWKMIDKDGNETMDIEKAVKVTTDYLSKEQEKEIGSNLIKALNKEAGITSENPDYKDIKISFKVIEPSTSIRILTNIAQISDDEDENGNPIEDIDSIPGNDNMEEDDIDVEHVKLVYFDLALRKFITKVDNLDINNRYPVLSMSEQGKIKYTHTKEPVEVENGNIVTYTIRVYNEGKMAGYAAEVTDNLPEGLKYLPENELNKTYRWKMIDKDGKETEDVEKAVKITTDYLSKEQEKQTGENLIKAFNSELGITNNNPDYRDVKIAFKVTEPNTSDRILINTAEISNDTDKEGDPVEDIDSTPGNNKDGEDDIDIEKVKVKYFDLALKKWVTQSIVIEDGKQTVTNTGHTGDENPEPVVKVDLKDKKINKVTVKFRYKIRVTNEGQIEGYVKEIKDYIPAGLKFVKEDNPDWTEVKDGVVATKKLENTLLRPGESATVEILLTWINSADNLGLKVNIAEISKDHNNSNTPDIDSTPDNFKPGEDDIDDAPVILSVKTGETTVYIGLTTIVLVTLAGGVYLIKKYVL